MEELLGKQDGICSYISFCFFFWQAGGGGRRYRILASKEEISRLLCMGTCTVQNLHVYRLELGIICIVQGKQSHPTNITVINITLFTS